MTIFKKTVIIFKSVLDKPNRLNIWRCIEVVITSTIGNRVAVMSGTRVQIPPTPPTKKSLLSTKTKVTFLNDVCLSANDVDIANDDGFA